MKLNRRTFLGSMGALGALGPLSLLNPSRAYAAKGPAKHFVLMFARGGWDPTYVFDPKPDSSYVHTGVGQASAFGNGMLWFDEGRPNVTEYFARYGSITSVVNGVNVPSIAHPSSTTRMLTGTRNASKPDIGAMIGHDLSDDAPMPYLDIGGTAYPGPYGADMGYLGARNQLKNLVIDSSAYRPPEGNASWERHFSSAEQEVLVRDFVERRVERNAQERAALGYNARINESYLLGLDRGHQLPGYTDFFADMTSAKTLEAQTEIAVNALSAGVSRAVHMTADGSFDTHDDNTEQIAQYDQTFAGLMLLMGLLETTPSRYGGMLIDDTVVMLVSEMGRTPLLNGDGGKDHWPFTSSLIAGCGIRGNTIVGGSDETFAGRTVDLQTGVPSDNGELLNNEYMLAGVLELFGIDPSRHLPDIIPCRGFHA
ncbi:MAG: DUF1501 domain-containing protein [Myxococcota bacterium]